MNDKKSRGWIGVDLDSTLAHYTHWVGCFDIGEPIWPMVERVKQWIHEGKTVKIVTARVSPQAIKLNGGDYDYTEAHICAAISDWCREHIGFRLAITCSKDLDMIELWDDRAVQVGVNTGEPVTYWTSRFA